MNACIRSAAFWKITSRKPAANRIGLPSEFPQIRTMCREDGVEPRKQFSGKFNVRISPELHAAIAAAAAADGKSLNQWVSDELRACVAGSG